MHEALETVDSEWQRARLIGIRFSVVAEQAESNLTTVIIDAMPQPNRLSQTFARFALAPLVGFAGVIHSSTDADFDFVIRDRVQVRCERQTGKVKKALQYGIVVESKADFEDSIYG